MCIQVLYRNSSMHNLMTLKPFTACALWMLLQNYVRNKVVLIILASIKDQQVGKHKALKHYVYFIILLLYIITKLLTRISGRSFSLLSNKSQILTKKGLGPDL